MRPGRGGTGHRWPGDATVSPAGDQQALADTVCRMLTGPAGPSPTSAKRPSAHLLRECRADLPTAVIEVLEQATALDPADRFADVAAFASAWQQAVRSNDRQQRRGPSNAASSTSQPIGTSRPESLVNPYKGLRAFGEADTIEFFGRDHVVDDAVNACRRERFVTVVGPSGSGKSSLIRAGVVPRLRESGAYVAAMVPGHHPMVEVTTALRQIAVATASPRDNTGERGEMLLDTITDLLPSGTDDAVIVVDQFEELWTLTERDERTRFLDALADAVDRPESRVKVIAVIRADFFDRPMQHPRIGPRLRAATIPVTAMAPDEVRQAVTNPAARIGIGCEPGLVAELVADVATHPGSLPMLQYALTELFERRTDATMTLAAYRAAGGLTGALTGRAEELCQRFEPAAVRQLFARLVTLGDNGTDIRRRAHRSDLAGIEDELIDAFGRHRLLTFDRDPGTREPTVEVAHEALLGSWPRLAGWLATGREELQVLRDLADGATGWHQRGRDPGDLYRGPRLDTARTYAGSHPATLTEHEQAFLSASVRRATRSRRLRTLATATLVALALVATATATGAIQQRRRADRAAATASASAARADVEAGQANQNAQQALDNATRAAAAETEQRDTATDAEIRQLALEGRELAASQPSLGLLLAAEAYQRLPHDIDTQGGLQASILANPYLQAVIPTGPIALRITSRITTDGIIASLTDNAINVTDLATLTTRLVPGDYQQAHSIELWPDDHTAAIPIGDTLRLVDLDNGKQAAPPIPLPAGKVNNLYVPPVIQHDLVLLTDGRLVVDDASGYTIVTTDFRTEQIPNAIPPSFLRGPAVATDTPVLVQGSPIGATIEVIHLDGSEPARTFDVATTNLNVWAINPDATRVVVGAANGDVVITDTHGTTITRRQVTDAVIGLTYLTDGRLAITTLAGTLQLTDPDTLEPLTTISLPAVGLAPPVFSPDARHAVASAGGSLAVLDLTGRSVLSTVAPGYVAGGLSPDGRRIAALRDDATVVVLDATTFTILAGPWQPDDVEPGNIGHYIAWSPDGTRFAIRGHTAHVNIIDATTGHNDIIPIAAASSLASTVTFTADNTHLLVPDEFTGIELIDLTTHTVVAHAFDPTWTVAFDATIDPDGTRFALDTFSTNELLLDTTTLKPVATCDTQAGFSAWDPTGHHLAVATHNGDVVILDQNCHRQLTLTGSHAAGSVRFTNDATKVLGRDLTGSRLWDLATGRQIGTTFPDPNYANTGYGITATGQLFTFALRDEQLLLVDLDPDHWLAHACTVAGRNLTTDEWTRYLAPLGPTDPPAPNTPRRRPDLRPGDFGCAHAFETERSAPQAISAFVRTRCPSSARFRQGRGVPAA